MASEAPIVSRKKKLSPEKLKELNFQSYYWCGTWQDTSIEPSEKIFEDKQKHVKYLIFQLERAPTTGKPHYQLYVEFTVRQRLSSLQKAFGQCYWQSRRGTAQSAIDYCSKTETRIQEPYIYGVPTLAVEPLPLASNPEQPRKKVSALQIVCDKLAKGNYNMNQLLKEHPSVFIRNHSGISKFIAATAPKRTWKPEVIVLYGLPECGKSRTAKELSLEYFKDEDIYKYSLLDTSGKEWWENYTGQPCVIIEEMEGCKLKFERLLELIDRYDTMVPCKGGSYQFLGKLIIFTSNYPPSSWYSGAKLWPALKRRIDRTYKFNLLEEDSLKSGTLIFEPELDQKEMHNSDDTTHFEEMFKMFKDQGYIKKRRTEPVEIDLNENEIDVVDAKEFAEED